MEIKRIDDEVKNEVVESYYEDGKPEIKANYKDENLNISDVSGRSLMSEFWKESADLIEKYRDGGDERAAQGVVSCRILIDRLMKQLENGG